MATDSSFDGLSVDPSKGTKLSMEKKRELVYEISNWSEGASEILQSWSRQEILQVLCAEMGKERKYTGLTKVKIIEHLLKIVSEKKSAQNEGAMDIVDAESAPLSGQRSAKRQRKNDQPTRLATAASNASSSGVIDLTNAVYCKNSACRATLGAAGAFCKRCSCCACFEYDDNKDPSLWLSCDSEPPFQGASCGMSCHLECALKNAKSGVGLEGRLGALDGSFQCLSCRKVNDLLGCIRKQLLMAKDTRRVDILCYRVSLSQKLLKGTTKYEMLYGIVDEAVKKLEAEVGPLTGLPVKMGRGIVNRLSSGPEVQNLCGSALDMLDSDFLKSISHSEAVPVIQAVRANKFIVPNMIKFMDIKTTSVTVILDSEDLSSEDNIVYTLWHSKFDDKPYPKDPTCKKLAPNTRFVIRGLAPSTEYCLKVASFDGLLMSGNCEVQFSTAHGDELVNRSVLERSQSPVTICSSLSNPSSVEDETNNGDRADDSNRLVGFNGTGVAARLVGSVSNSKALMVDEERSSEGKKTIEDVPVRTGTECVPFVGRSETNLPVTPCKLEKLKEGPSRTATVRSKSVSKDLENGDGKGDPRDGSTSKNGLSDRDFEYYVKIIRWLECEGHIEKNFRQKFLTWYSLRATPEEVRIVKVFIDTFIEDPASLAGQLVDTFSACLSSKRSSVVPNGFCMKLWH